MELEQKIVTYKQRALVKAALRGVDRELARAIEIFTGFTRASKSAYGTPSGVRYHKNRQVFTVWINIDGCGEIHIGTYVDSASAVAAWKIAKIADLDSLRKKYPEMPESLYDFLRELVESVEL